MNQPVAMRITALGQAMHHFTDYLEASSYFEKSTLPNINNFALGNPQDMPLDSFVEAVKHAADPRDKNWFAYKLSEPQSQEIVATSLSKELGIPFEPTDIAMTNGAFGALTVAMHVVLDAGDEVIINLPPWFFYESMVVGAGGVPIKIPVHPQTFDLDLAAIEAAMYPAHPGHHRQYAKQPDWKDLFTPDAGKAGCDPDGRI